MAPQRLSLFLGSSPQARLYSVSGVYSFHLIGLGSAMRYFGMSCSTFEQPKRIHI